MKSKMLAIGLPLFVITAAALVVWLDEAGKAPLPAAIDLPCPDPAAGCSIRIGERVVTVGLTGPLKPLQPFQVWVKVPGADKIQANFTMVSMNMGLNLYTLRPDQAGVFRARVILPTCVSGRRDWVMTLDIDGATRLAMPFATSL